jgi:type I restriction enzyme S subunit
VDRAIEQTEALIAKQQRIKTGLMQDLLTRGIDKHGNLRSEQTHQFKDSALGRIPVEWEVKSLEQLTTRIVDGVHHTPAYVESGIPFIVITDLTGSADINFSNTRFVSERDHREFSKRANPKSGDVLVTKDGTLGIARIVPPDAPVFSIFVSVAMLRPNQNVCLPELIWSFFESCEFLVQLGALSAGTGLAHIHLEHFRSFLLRHPPIDEQQLIFCTISKQQDLLNSAMSGLNKLKKQKTALMQDLLSGKVRVTSLLNNTETGV